MRAIRGLVALAIVVAVVVGVGLLIWNRSYRHAGPENPGFNCPEVVAARHRLPFTATNVHRVALIGDSIMVQASCAIADSLSDLGIQTSRHAIWASGLLVGPDWLAKTREIMATEKPDAVIAIFNGNYLFATVPDANGQPIEAGTPAFLERLAGRRPSNCRRSCTRATRTCTG